MTFFAIFNASSNFTSPKSFLSLRFIPTSIITEFDYDHTHILGESIDLITSEKCVIFKKDIPALTGNSNKEVIEIIEQHAKDKNCDFKKIDMNKSKIIKHNSHSLVFLYD